MVEWRWPRRMADGRSYGVTNTRVREGGEPETSLAPREATRRALCCQPKERSTKEDALCTESGAQEEPGSVKPGGCGTQGL